MRHRRRALQFGAGRAEDAGQRLAAKVVAAETVDAYRTGGWLRAIIVAAVTVDGARAGAWFRTVVVTAAFLNAVRDANTTKQLETELTRERLR